MSGVGAVGGGAVAAPSMGAGMGGSSACIGAPAAVGSASAPTQAGQQQSAVAGFESRCGGVAGPDHAVGTKWDDIIAKHMLALMATQLGVKTHA